MKAMIFLKKFLNTKQDLELTCRFTWTENAVCIWDNRSVIHFVSLIFIQEEVLDMKE